MSKDLLVRDAWSADMYSEEIKTNMTELAQILTLCKETIFTVCFNKKIDEKEVEAKLAGIKLTDPKNMKQIQQIITEGEECVITGHLAGQESDLGRSLIIDLNADPKSNYRQVDHRTINWIVFKNVKYSLGKKTDDRELPLKIVDGDRWDKSQLVLN